MVCVYLKKLNETSTKVKLFDTGLENIKKEHLISFIQDDISDLVVHEDYEIILCDEAEIRNFFAVLCMEFQNKIFEKMICNKYERMKIVPKYINTECIIHIPLQDIVSVYNKYIYLIDDEPFIDYLQEIFMHFSNMYKNNAVTVFCNIKENLLHVNEQLVWYNIEELCEYPELDDEFTLNESVQHTCILQVKDIANKDNIHYIIGWFGFLEEQEKVKFLEMNKKNKEYMLTLYIQDQ